MNNNKQIIRKISYIKIINILIMFLVNGKAKQYHNNSQYTVNIYIYLIDFIKCK